MLLPSAGGFSLENKRVGELTVLAGVAEVARVAHARVVARAVDLIKLFFVVSKKGKTPRCRCRRSRTGPSSTASLHSSSLFPSRYSNFSASSEARLTILADVARPAGHAGAREVGVARRLLARPAVLAVGGQAQTGCNTLLWLSHSALRNLGTGRIRTFSLENF